MSPQTVKVWFITGCSTGFGAALARELLSRGQTVIASARNVDALADLKTAGADVVRCDVADPLETLVQTAQQVIDLHGRVDYLVNNAGFCLQGTVEELTPRETRSQFDTNVFGTLNVTRAFLPHFRSLRAGVIANVSSMGAWRGTPGLGIYEASKWTVSGLSETLRAELADFGITVCCVEPGSFRSNFLTPGNRKVLDEGRISDYDGTAARKVTAFMDRRDGAQPGDLKRGVKVIVDVLSMAQTQDIPLRLPLGSDAYQTIKNKCEATLRLLESLKPLITATDHDDVSVKS